MPDQVYNFQLKIIFLQNFESIATLLSSIYIATKPHFLSCCFELYNNKHWWEFFLIHYVGPFSLEIHALQFWESFLCYLFENFLPLVSSIPSGIYLRGDLLNFIFLSYYEKFGLIPKRFFNYSLPFHGFLLLFLGCTTFSRH